MTDLGCPDPTCPGWFADPESLTVQRCDACWADGRSGIEDDDHARMAAARVLIRHCAGDEKSPLVNDDDALNLLDCIVETAEGRAVLLAALKEGGRHAPPV